LRHSHSGRLLPWTEKKKKAASQVPDDDDKIAVDPSYGILNFLLPDVVSYYAIELN
jgi:hypothetical protein